jgi:hypothetical protein
MNLARRAFTSLLCVAAACVVLAGLTSPAAAFNLRVPQVAVAGGSLQGYLNGVGEAINVNTDQLDAQTWNTSVSGNSTFTLMVEFAGNAGSNGIGVYNAADAVPALFQVFPGAATAGWFATCHFAGGNLVVTLFDNNSIIQGQVTYGGVSQSNFGFYLQGPGGTFYSQDSRNAGGVAQILTYAGTGQNFGDWWECFEDLSPAGGSDRDFDDAVLLLQSVGPTPTANRSWGAIKTLYK